MLEEYTMDKKPSVRSGQGPAKGNSTESKKAQDATSGKQFPKGGRKRETASSNGAKYDQNRKPPPQKSKALDKRPRPRGVYYGSGKENSQIREEKLEAERGSIFATGSKKQPFNYWLNFHYEPRGETMPTRAQHNYHGRSTKSLMATQTHMYNKEQFLQANCQFVVREDGDYSSNLRDPDLLVDWNLIELIVIGSVEKVICPICIFAPVAGKITRCGHVYCWSCILHYLALVDKTWRKCPICPEAIHKNDLKSVECIEKIPFAVGDRITLKLMKREKNTLVASPVEQFCTRSSTPILSYGETQLDTVYSKLLTASKETVLDIINHEFDGLKAQVEEFKDDSSVVCFVEQAMVLLTERKNNLLDREKEKQNAASSSLENTKEEINLFTSENEIAPIENVDSAVAASCEPAMLSDAYDCHKLNLRKGKSNNNTKGEDVPNVRAEDLDIGNQNCNSNSKYYYFYQASDGQQIYLHSINVRTLEACYGSLEQCPQEISGKIIEKETGSMTSQLRKRLRYLEHIPITCQFEVIELELRPPVVSAEALARFQDKIEERRRRRQHYAREEKKWERRMEAEERKRNNRYPTPNLCIESYYDFPQCGLEDTARSSVISNQSMEPSVNRNRTESPVNLLARDTSPMSSAVAALSLEEDNSNVGPSFAQMLRGRKSPTHQDSWPCIGSSEGFGNNNVWPRRQRQPSVSQEYIDSDNESSQFSPPARPSFNIGEAIQLAASLEKGENSSSGNGRKKKKKQQKIVFSTGIQKGM